MSVDPLEQQTRHYGSEYTMVDYKTNSLNLFLNISYTFSPKMMMYGTVTFNTSTAELNQVIMPDISDRLQNELTGTTDLTHQDFTFTEMHEYSDLDYELIGTMIGFEYRLAPDITWTVDGRYYDLTDNDGYVYGDETGSLFIIRSGLKFEF